MLKAAGKLSILNHLSSTFTKMSIGGTYSIGASPGVPFNLVSQSAGAGQIVQGSDGPVGIEWYDGIVFNIVLSEIYSGEGAPIAQISYVRLLNADDEEVLRTNFSQSYSYAGNGTYTVTSVYVGLA